MVNNIDVINVNDVNAYIVRIQTNFYTPKIPNPLIYINIICILCTLDGQMFVNIDNMVNMNEINRLETC